MSESNTSYYIKQVWRQKGDVRFEQIPFKEENKANELSQTTRPVLLLETKANGGSGAIFAIGRISEPTVVEKAIQYPGGEFTYHVPFSYELELKDKSQGITREDLQELSGLKFAPQVKAGLYEIEESLYEKLSGLLKERAGETGAADGSAPAEQPVQAGKTPEQDAKAATGKAAPNGDVLTALRAAHQELLAKPESRLVAEDGTFRLYPASLLAATQDLTQLQTVIRDYITQGGHQAVEQAASEAAATGIGVSPRFAKIVGLAARLVEEGKYDRVTVPTRQEAFYLAGHGHLPHPYEAIELQGKMGHYVLGVDGTLYTVEGKTVQHFLGL